MLANLRSKFRSSSLGLLLTHDSLPLFLSRSILNVDPTKLGMKDDSSVLAMPNHTVLNHLMTSNVKNKVLATAVTTRYRKKVGYDHVLCARSQANHDSTSPRFRSNPCPNRLNMLRNIPKPQKLLRCWYRMHEQKAGGKVSNYSVSSKALEGISAYEMEPLRERIISRTKTYNWPITAT